jgi:hypothetical protein
MIVTEVGKYTVEERVNPQAPFEVVMTLTIVRTRTEDFGQYKCNSKNSLGEADGVIDVHRKIFSHYPPITYYWTVLLILDHSNLIGKLASWKIADTKVSGF